MPGRRFSIPKFSFITFKANNSQVKNLPMISKWIDEMLKCSKLSENVFDVSLRSIFEYVFHIFPICKDSARYEWVFKYNYLLFIIDDHCELDWRDVEKDRIRVMAILEQLRKSLSALQQQESLSTDREWEPYIRVNHEVLSKICGYFSHMQSIRFIEAYEDFLEGLIQETLNVVKKIECNSIKDYLKVRIKSCAMLTAINLTEYCLGLTLTDEEYRNPLTQKCIKYAIKCVILANDIFSFEKEYNRHNGELDKMWNAVSKYALLKSCVVEESFIAVAIMNDQCEQKLIDSVKNALNRKNISNDLREFLKHLQVMVGGYIKSNTLVDRYNYFLEQAEDSC